MVPHSLYIIFHSLESGIGSTEGIDIMVYIKNNLFDSLDISRIFDLIFYLIFYPPTVGEGVFSSRQFSCGHKNYW